MKRNLQTILEIFKTKGNQQYGQAAVTQLEHALQSALLAEKENSTPELITACLLHDFGHLIHDLGEDVALRG